VGNATFELFKFSTSQKAFYDIFQISLNQYYRFKEIGKITKRKKVAERK
jgi:hypothetical protein